MPSGFINGVRAQAAPQAKFDGRRRKIKLSFAQLLTLFASDLSHAEIAIHAGVSRVRLNAIYRQYFAKLFKATALERRRQREKEQREKIKKQLDRVIARDQVLNAINVSAERARPKPTIEPILLQRNGALAKRYRHRAVLVNGRNIEAVHHVRNSVPSQVGIIYAATTLYRSQLKGSCWTIFVLDVPGFRRRVIRSRNKGSSQALLCRAPEALVYLHPAARASEDPSPQLSGGSRSLGLIRACRSWPRTCSFRFLRRVGELLCVASDVATGKMSSARFCSANWSPSLRTNPSGGFEVRDLGVFDNFGIFRLADIQCVEKNIASFDEAQRRIKVHHVPNSAVDGQLAPRA